MTTTSLLHQDAATGDAIPGGEVSAVRRAASVLLPPIVVAVLGCWGISLGSALSNDESATIWAGRYLSLPELLHLLGHVDAVHGLYYLLIHGWSGLVGNSPAALRVPSVLALSAAAGVIVVIGRRLTDSSAVGLCAGLIMALTPSVSLYAQTARPYAMVYLAVVTGTLALLRALDAERNGGPTAARRRRWVVYACLIALVGYLNELALAVVVAHGLTLCWAHVSRRTACCWLAASAGGSLLVVPLIAVSTRQTGQVGWLVVPGADSVWTLFHVYFGASALIAAALLALAVVGAAVCRRSEHDGLPTLASVAVPLLVAPAVVIALASVAVRPLFDARYVFYAEAGAALLAAGGAVAIGHRIRRAPIRLLAAAALCAVVFAGQYGDQRRQREPLSRGGYGEVAAFVASHAKRGDGLVFAQNYYRKIRLAYPDRFRKVTDLTVDQTPLQAADFRGTELPIGRSRPLLSARRRIWTIGSWTPGGRPPEGKYLRGRLALRVVRAEFRPIRSARYDDVRVRLWVRRPAWP